MNVPEIAPFRESLFSAAQLLRRSQGQTFLVPGVHFRERDLRGPVVCCVVSLGAPLDPDVRRNPLLFVLLDTEVVGNRNTVLSGKGHDFSA